MKNDIEACRSRSKDPPPLADHPAPPPGTGAWQGHRGLATAVAGASGQCAGTGRAQAAVGPARLAQAKRTKAGSDLDGAEVMQHWLQSHHLPRRWVGTTTPEQVQAVTGVQFDPSTPEHQGSRSDCPVLLVHGTQDRTMPLSDAHRLVRFFSNHLEAIAHPCSND